MKTLRKRREFTALRGRPRVLTKAFSIQTMRNPANGGVIRLGLTVTKKVGNAVFRNRIRRRLRRNLPLLQRRKRMARPRDFAGDVRSGRPLAKR